MAETVAALLARRLSELGCKRAFGIPGGEVLTLLEALRQHGFRFVISRHETSAGMMAEGSYLATGVPGLLVATVGPGAANCVNAVAQSMLDRVPLVFVSGAVPDDVATQYTHQLFDQLAVFRPLTKFSTRLKASTAATDIERGIAMMLEGRPGPVHFDLPYDVAAAPVLDSAPQRFKKTPPPTRSRDENVIAKLRQARRPLIVAGLDLVPDGSAALMRLAESWSIPVLLTYKTIGFLPDQHALCLGTFGLSPQADQVLLPLIQRADLILSLGYDPVETRQGWIDAFPRSAHVVEVRAFRGDHNVHRVDTLIETASVARWAEAHCGGGGTPWTQEPQQARDRLRKIFQPAREREVTQYIQGLSELLEPDEHLTVDTGAHRILLSQFLRGIGPNRVHQSTGLCTMAYALPAAIGLAASGERVTALMGDGGFEMGLGELLTARDLCLDLTVIVFDDRSLALIDKKQRERALPDFGVNYVGRHPDYSGLAMSVGATYERVTTSAGFRQAFAKRGSGLYIIQALVERRAYDGLF